MRAQGRGRIVSGVARALATASALAILLGAGRALATNYVFATFTGDPLPDERLSIYKASDALDFTLVSNTGFAGPSGALRDPSIMRHTDGKYYVAYTDPPGAGCCGKEDHFSIAQSADLVHWTNLTTVPGAVPGLAHVWAPEWFVDAGAVMVIANIDTKNTDSDFKPYVFTALDDSLTSWSGPTAVGIGPNYIDTFVLKVKSTYHLFAKNETTRYVEHATAAGVTGPWTFVGTGNWAGWGSGMEGPCVVLLDDDTWRIYLDGQGSVGFLYSNSSDLMTWSKTSPLPMLSNVVRHGTVIRDEPPPGGGGGGSGAGSGGAGGGGGGSGAGGGGGRGGGAGGTGGAGHGGAAGAGTGAVGGLGGGRAGAGGDETTGAAGAVTATGAGGAPSVHDAGTPGAAGAAGAGGGPSPESSGCQCSISDRPSPEAGLALALVFAAVLLRKRSRPRCQSVVSRALEIEMGAVGETRADGYNLTRSHVELARPRLISSPDGHESPSA